MNGPRSVLSPGIRLLVVDDEKGIRESFPLLLGGYGYGVKTCSNPEDAARLISGEQFDIVFLDQYLGRTKGLDLMKTLSEKCPEVYFVIITGNSTPDLAVEAMRQGAADFVGKPFTAADLIKSIEYVNKKRKLDRERKEMLATLEAKVQEKTEEVRRLFFSVLSSFAQAMEKKDIGTYGHCRRVSHYAGLIATALDLEEEEKIGLKAAAMLHDIGKIGISDFVLGKKGALSEDERNIVRNHPAKGVEILKPIKQFNSLLPVILHHHENYDGSGYPYGLAGENIPLPARIISIADAYDAILSGRVYRPAANHEKAVSELVSFAGRQFDPFLVQTFVDADARYKRLFGTLQTC